MVLLFCWVGMVGIKSGNACGKDKDENAVVLPVYERNGRMYVEIEQTYLGREWMVLAQIDRGLGIRGKLLESKGIFRLEQGRDSMTLDVFAVFCPERVSDTTWMSNGLLKMSGLQTPVETWPVAEKKETGYLIDVTDGIKEKWYVGDGKWGRIQYGRSEIITVDTCRNGACFTIRHYLECSPEQQVVEMLPESGSVPVEVSVALCLLPDRGLRNRGEDPDGLFRTQVYVDDNVVLVGDARRVVYNMIQDIMIESDKDIKKHVTTYSGYARGSGALIDPDSFAQLTITTGSGG